MHAARAYALTLPEAVEQDHHGIPSFRVRGRIFATAPDDDHLRIMAEEGEIRAAVAEDPNTFATLRWGSRLACVVVDLRLAPAEQVCELLTEAWRRKAPRRLVGAFDGEGGAPVVSADHDDAAHQVRVEGADVVHGPAPAEPDRL